ncbi:MAG: sigma 54-interacting transcriptional regulator [bacterium]|nr:sigma 54-interacting transcriptional regulator [Candidatus Kapabacteria bacterium]
MTLPFTAIVGFSLARRALMCTLVDPTLRGVVVSGPVGTGKSSLMRGFVEFVRAVDPDAPVVNVPLGVTDDRLIGGVDLDASLAAGELRAGRGLLAAVDGGYLFVDDLPLLDAQSIAMIVRALESESAVVEREGISRRDNARFVLLATTVPTERDLSFANADRVAFLIGSEERSDGATQLLMRRIHQFNEHPVDLLRDVEPMQQRAAEQVATARLMHPMITLDEGTLKWIAEESQRLQIAGNRADVFAAKAARAHAALRGAREIGEDDLQFALATVLAPRAQNIPHDENGGDAEGGEEGGEDENDTIGEHSTDDNPDADPQESEQSIQPNELPTDAVDNAQNEPHENSHDEVDELIDDETQNSNESSGSFSAKTSASA